LLAITVEGDSLAWQMRPALERRLPIESYEAIIGLDIKLGITRVLARHVKGKIVLVSLGTNDVLRTDLEPITRRRVERQARRLTRVAKCVVWSQVRITRPGYGRKQRIVNSGLKHSPKVHLVSPPAPDFGDGVHFSVRHAQILAGRFDRMTRRNC
jgi:hypothetical protein